MKLNLFFLLCLCLNLGYSQSIQEDKIDLLETMITQKMVKDKIPGLSIAIIQNKKILWTKGFGYADLENKVPASSLTAYRSASIGKPITATAAMKLVENGNLDINKSIQKYCPQFPQKKWKINTRHLLAHLSGIRHYGGPRNDDELNSNIHYNNIIDPLVIFKNDPLLFEPGTKSQYSTYGYNVLGCVIQGAAKMPFIDFLTHTIFERAEMENTQIDDPYKIIPNRSRGYRLNQKGEVEHCQAVNMTNKIPAGGYITTAPDLARYAAYFMANELVGESTKKEMLSPQRTTKGKTLSYGLGWGLFPDEKWYGEVEAFHGGGSPGVSGVLYLLPDRQFAVAILTNLEGVSDRVGFCAEIAKLILDLKGN